MRACAALIALTAVLGAQEAPPDRPPQKGDKVVVRGCVSGPVLEATQIARADSTRAPLPTLVRFRLTGDKKLLKEMREAENGRVVEITGVLKSELPQGDSRPGRQVGKTRIVVGVGTPSAGTMERQAPPSFPALQVKSYEPLVASCGG